MTNEELEILRILLTKALRGPSDSLVYRITRSGVRAINDFTRTLDTVMNEIEDRENAR